MKVVYPRINLQSMSNEDLAKGVEQVDKALGSVPLFASFEKSSGIRKIHLLGLSTSMLLVVLLVFKNVYAGIITDTIGYLYPALLSLKAVGGDKDVQAQWLGYWVIFGFFHLCEYAIEGVLRVFPFYFPFKLFTIIWLISPSTKGAASVYTKVLKPFIPVCENLGKALVNRGKPSKPADKADSSKGSSGDSAKSAKTESRDKPKAEKPKAEKSRSEEKPKVAPPAEKTEDKTHADAKAANANKSARGVKWGYVKLR